MRSIFCLVAIGVGLATSNGIAHEPPMVKPKLGPNSAAEPLTKQLSLIRAGEFLDAATLAWHNAKQCASCHTTYPYMMARSALGEAKAPVYQQMRTYFEERVAKWDEGGKGAGLFEGSEGVTEVVAIAATLAFDDRQQGRTEVHARTRQALDRMWTLQEKDGSWSWNKHLLPPQEFDEYYGVVYAALGVSQAPGNYAQSDSAKAGIAKMTQYLKKNPPPNLHHKTFLLWASLKLDGLMTVKERDDTIKQLLALQRKDGGWNLPSLGNWKRLNGDPNDNDAPSDGYATGLTLYVLRQAGIAKNDAPIQLGVQWLKTNQRETGRWFTRSVNADRAHYNTVAGTAYAVMALKACGD